MNDALTRRVQAGEGKDRLLLEAKEIVYDNDNNTVSAVGDVELYYQGRTLQADRVTYDRKSGRVFAQGNARMIDANGAVITGDRFDLTEDFKNGFIDSLRVEQTVIQRGRASRTYFSAPRAERIEGDHDGLRARHLHGLRALQGAPRAAAAVAGEGGADHPQQRRADDLLRERDARALRLSRSPTCRISGRPIRR